MKKIIYIILFLLMLPISSKAISTSATSAILMEMDSHRILYENNIHNVRSVASISKIMTCILAIENADLNKKIIVGDEIDKSYGSGIYIKKGEELTIGALLYGLMLRSGNDASYAIAKNTFGSVDKFIEEMNLLAKKIGMKNSVFHNPNGLDEENGNYSTAYDMALLTSYAYQNEMYRKITSTKKYQLKTNMNTYIWYNKHKLLGSYEYATGGKTGYTKIAKRTLVTTGSKDDLNLVVVTLNDGNDFNDHKNLLQYGFDNYKKYQILKKGKLTIDDSYYKNYELYINHDFYYPLDNQEKDTIKIDYELEKSRNIKNNIKVGKAKVYVSGELIKEEDIYVKKIIKENEKEKNFFKKIIDWFKKL